MAFLDKTGLQTLTNKLVQGDAIKVASHRGKNVKEVIDNIQRECENVALPNTMTLENRVNEFKVGQGRDVDVSGDVEEGKINVELQGKTYQNLCRSSAGVSIQYIADYEIKDRANYLEVTRIAENNNGWYYFSNKTLKVSMLKPNTTYTVFFKYESTCNNMPRLQIIQGNALEWLSDPTNSVSLTNNIYRCVIKTSSSFEGKKVGAQMIYFHNSQPNKVGDTVILYKNMLFLEGDYSNLQIEELPNYFEGIKSSFEDGVVDVEVQGKNLVDLSKFNRVSNAVSQVNIVNNTISFSSSTRYNGVGQTFSKEEYKKMVGKYVTVSCGKITTSTGDSNDAYVFLKQSFVNSDGSTTWNNSIIASGQSKKIKILEGVDLTRFGIFVEPSNPVSGSIDIKAENIQLEIDSTSASYEPYYKKKISFNIGEPLRSLSNGICDEIRNNNGQWELVRRVGKLVFDGTENWMASGTPPDDTNFKRFDLTLSNTLKKGDSVKLLCNNLPHIYIHSLPNGSKSITQECISHHSVDINTTNVVLKTSTIGGTSVANFKQYLSNNSLVVYYELQSPIITPIEPIEFNTSQGAVINISSDISPTSTHKVILNRAGQIEQGIELIANLKSRVNELENIYDSNLIATQYKLDNLKLNYELEREED